MCFQLSLKSQPSRILELQRHGLPYPLVGLKKLLKFTFIYLFSGGTASARATIQMWRSEDNLMELELLSHFVGPWDELWW